MPTRAPRRTVIALTAVADGIRRPDGKPRRADSLETMWIQIGHYLRDRRLARRWSATEVQRRGGPTYHTVLKTEDGELAKPDLLARHAAALDLDMVDIVRAIVCARSFSPDASAVARTYDRTTPHGQDALKALATALDAATAAASATREKRGSKS